MVFEELSPSEQLPQLYFEFWSKVREAQALDLRDGFDDFDMLSGPPVDAAYVPNKSGLLVAPSA